MLTYHKRHSVAFTRGLFYRKCSWTLSVTCAWRLHFKIITTSPRGQWVDQSLAPQKNTTLGLQMHVVLQCYTHMYSFAISANTGVAENLYSLTIYLTLLCNIYDQTIKWDKYCLMSGTTKTKSLAEQQPLRDNDDNVCDNVCVYQPFDTSYFMSCPYPSPH